MRKSFTFRGLQRSTTTAPYGHYHKTFTNYPESFAIAYEVKVNPEEGIRFVRRPVRAVEDTDQKSKYLEPRLGYEPDWTDDWKNKANAEKYTATPSTAVFFLTLTNIKKQFGGTKAGIPNWQIGKKSHSLKEFAADYNDAKIIDDPTSAQMKSLIEGPYNYLFGPVERHRFNIMLDSKTELDNSDSGVPSFSYVGDDIAAWQWNRLPRNLHYFDLTLPINEEVDKDAPQDTLYVTAQPNYNFYVPPLEALDEKFLSKFPSPASNFGLVNRPDNFYAYTSLKIRDIDTIKGTEFALKTLYQHNKTLGMTTALYAFDVKTKLNGFFNNYLQTDETKKSIAKIGAVGWNSAYQNSAASYYNSSLQTTADKLAPINFQINPSSFISADKLLVEATNAREKTLPFSITVESNYNAVPENANNEFKQILKDLNLYETFIYNLIDRHSGPFFSISDDAAGQNLKPSIGTDDPMVAMVTEQHPWFSFAAGNSGNKFLFDKKTRSPFAVPRAPLVMETLKYAFGASGLISPKAPQQAQAKSLEGLKTWVTSHVEPALEKLWDYSDEVVTKDSAGSVVSKQGIAAASAAKAKPNSDFIYTFFEENTTVTDFDAFVFAGKVTQFINKNYLSLAERMFKDPNSGILRKKPLKNYVEILAYSVQRHRVVRAKGNVANIWKTPEITDYQFEQEYIFPASMDKNDILKCVDAGVTYDTEYVYKIYCHVLSLGTGVKTNRTIASVTKAYKGIDHGISLGPNGTTIIKMEGLSYPDLRIMRVPVFQTKPKIIYDMPPAFPSTVIIPSRHDPSKVKLVFSENVGGYIAAPKAITANDLVEILKIIKRYPDLDKDNAFASWLGMAVEADPVKGGYKFSMVKVGVDWSGWAAYLSKMVEQYKFDSKSPIVQFEILRLDEAPTHYLQFKNAKRFIVNKSEGVGVTQTIEPNKTYYYCFRTINAHGIASNPSPILSLNVYSDGDLHTAEVKPFSFESEIHPEPPIKPLPSAGIISVSLSAFQALVTNPSELEAYEKDPLSSKAGNLKQIDDTGPNPTTSDAIKKEWFETSLKLKAENPDKNEAMDTGGKTFFKVRARSKTTGRAIDLNFYPKLKRLDRIGDVGEEGFKKMKSEGFSGGDLVELSNYFDMSVKSLKTLINNKDEIGVDPVLIETIVEKIRNNQLDQQALESLLVNFGKLKST